MARKTYEVATIVGTANTILALPSTGDAPEEGRACRIGVIIMVEAVLHGANAYKGFRMLASEYLPAEEQTLDNVLVPDYDDTRRQYFA